MSYALTPVSLDRRMLLAAWAQGAPSAPVNGQVVAYSGRPWQVARKFTYFFVGDVPVEDIRVAGEPLEPVSARWVSHTLFGVELVRERILWLEGQDVRVSLDGVPVRVAPFGGFPKIPVPESFVISKVSAPTRPGLVARVRRALWRLRRRKVQAAQPAVSSAQASEEAVETWFYMDRVHRAGDNAEALYRFAVGAVPQVRHVFALSSESEDWARLEGEGFDLVDAADGQVLAQAVAGARELLVSDISDRVLAPLLGGLGAEQRLVFLQHGILRHEHWRWLNPRRIDLLLTTADDETVSITANGSSYTLSEQEVAQTGLPRHDRLIELALAENRQDRVLIAPTWNRNLLTADAEELQAWVNSWISPFTDDSFSLLLPAVEPVLFVHPNLEEALSAAGVQIPVTTVFGAEVQEVLVRCVAVVTDRSSLVDEAVELGVPGIMVGSDALVSATRVYSPSVESRILRVPGENMKQLQQAVLTAAVEGWFECRLKPGASERVVQQLRSSR